MTNNNNQITNNIQITKGRSYNKTKIMLNIEDWSLFDIYLLYFVIWSVLVLYVHCGKLSVI